MSLNQQFKVSRRKALICLISYFFLRLNTGLFWSPVMIKLIVSKASLGRAIFFWQTSRIKQGPCHPWFFAETLFCLPPWEGNRKRRWEHFPLKTLHTAQEYWWGRESWCCIFHWTTEVISWLRLVNDTFGVFCSVSSWSGLPGFFSLCVAMCVS